MSSFSITGGKRISGCLVPQGAKNEALQVICACLLTKERVTIHNVPLIRDVLKLVELLQAMGVKTERPEEHTFVFEAKDIDETYLHTEDFRRKTGSRWSAKPD